MAEELGKLSPEQIKQLSKTISEAKGLTDRQAEMVEKVLTSEIDIGKIRISYLKEYFDIYSKNLDLIVKKYSQLNEAYLAIDKKIAENYKTSSPDNNKSKGSSGGSSSGGSSGGGSSNSGGSGGGDEPSAPKNNKKNKAVSNTVDPEKRARMKTIDENATHEKHSRQEVINFLDSLSASYYKTEEERENDILKTRSANDKYAAQLLKDRTSRYEAYAEKEAQIEKSRIQLYNLRHQDEIDKTDLITEIRLSRLQEVTSAEMAAQKSINKFDAELDFSSSANIVDEKGNDTGVNEAGALRAQQAQAESLAKLMKKQEADRVEYIRKRELEAKRKNNGVLSKEEATRIQKEAAAKFKLDKANLEKIAAEQEKKEAGKALKKEIKDNLNTLKTAESWDDRKQALKELTHDADGNFNTGKALSAAIYAVSDLAKQLEKDIDTIAGHKKDVDTRLQGSNNDKTWTGSYWDQLVKDMTSVGAINPYFKQETFATNIKELVKQGISFDLKQRAFLMTIQEKIANTFNVADGTLLRLVRIQQEDSTAGRLGMESALNAFLNNMYETSEYLSDVASSVRSSLEEMEALMQGAEATEVEYQIQKWLGSLYSVGMSQNAVTGISTALGQIAAGQIEGLTNGGAGNLLIMAANDAGLSIADILTEGIDSTDTNKLLQAAVNYLAELSDSAKDNKVVQQQLADVFGVKASDLKAATGLVSQGTTEKIFGNSMSYGNMISQLAAMAGSMGNRTSVAEMMTNFWENGKYTLAGSMASSPISYFIYKMASVLDSAAGGIDIPFLNVMGFGVDLNTTVSDLMRLAAVGGGILGSLGPIVSGLGSSFDGRAMLTKLGIGSGSGLAVTPRGSGGGTSQGGGSSSTSGSGYVGNSSGNDVKNSTLQEAEDSKKQQMIEAKEEADANQVDILNATVIKIYELLEDVAHGNSSFQVKVEGYGLTKAGGGSSGAQSGIQALSGNGGNTGSGSGYANGASSGGGVNSGGIGGSINLGGWTTTT